MSFPAFRLELCRLLHTYPQSSKKKAHGTFYIEKKTFLRLLHLQLISALFFCYFIVVHNFPTTGNLFMQ